jgi:hypothetical protein
MRIARYIARIYTTKLYRIYPKKHKHTFLYFFVNLKIINIKQYPIQHLIKKVSNKDTPARRSNTCIEFINLVFNY